MAGPSLSTQPRPVRDYTSNAGGNIITGAATYLARPQNSPVLATTNGSNLAVFYLDPEDLEIYNRRLLFRLRAQLATGDVNPAQTVRFGLFSVSGVAGNQAGQTTTLGAEVAGSETPSRAVGAANTLYGPDSSGDFEITAAGLYVIGLVAAGAMAATSYFNAHLNLSALTR